MSPAKNGHARKHIQKLGMSAAGIGFILLILSILFAAPGKAESLAQAQSDGNALFQQKCAACHTIGGGKLVGPDLAGVAQRRDRAWIVEFVQAPDKVIASGDATATQLLQEYNNVAMPNLGLPAAEVEALVAYLENPAAGGGVTQAPAPAPVVGDPLVGEMIFSGKQPLAGGGVACIACHTAGNAIQMGGGSLGPDLTQVMTRYGGLAGMSATLAGLPFPTMQGIFTTRPLSPQEQSDLLAYFQQTNAQVAKNPQTDLLLFLGLSAAVMIVLTGVLALYWPRQRRSQVEILRQKASQSSATAGQIRRR